MNVQCEQKLNSLKRFLPFLTKFLEKLKSADEEENNDATKLEQMQLLFELLTCPGTSISIEELNRLEQALIAFHKTYEGDADELLPAKESVTTAKEEEVKENEEEHIADHLEDQAVDTETGSNNDISTKEPHAAAPNVLDVEEKNQSVGENCTTTTKVPSTNDKENQSNEENCATASKMPSADDEDGQLTRVPIKDDKENQSSADEESIQSTEENCVTTTKMSCSDEEDSQSTRVPIKDDEENQSTADKIPSADEDESQSTVENGASATKAPYAAEEDSQSTKVQIKDGEEDNQSSEENCATANNIPLRDEEKEDDQSTGENCATADKMPSADEDDSQLTAENGATATKVPSVDEEESQSTRENCATDEQEEEYESDEDNDEENVEIVKMPNADTEEMILPDSADDIKTLTNSNNSNSSSISNSESNNGNSNDVNNDDDNADAETEAETGNSNDLNKGDNDNAESDAETGNSNDVNKDDNAESEAETELLMSQDKHEFAETTLEPSPLFPFLAESEQVDCNDPLNCEDNALKEAAKEEVVETNAVAEKDEEDDDDVQVIETRNSPICVDTDEDDAIGDTDLLVPLPTPTITTPLLQKTRKVKQPSTTSPVCVAKAKQPVFILPACAAKAKQPAITPPVCAAIDTIELLDSSDDEAAAATSSKIMRHKRTKLMLKKCLLKKSAKRPLRTATPTKLYLTPPKRAQSDAPTQVHRPTPQSDFLNAVNLLPANSINPPAFSTKLCNKNVIIPNAFYGNPPDKREPNADNLAAEAAQQRALCRWLENFLLQFSSPQQVATHSCFILLQRVLKYRVFQKIKDLRTNLNVLAMRPCTLKNNVDFTLLLEMRNIFYRADGQLSDMGFKFCELATSRLFGKSVILTTELKTGRVTSRTMGDEIASQTPSAPKASVSLTTGRKKQADLDDYTPPNKAVLKAVASTSGDGEGNGRKRSLRTNRGKRQDDSFTYNEEQHDAEFEEKAADEEDENNILVQRKIEQKRQEAKAQREKMAKSFEMAYIQAFSQNDNEQPPAKKIATEKSQRKLRVVAPLPPAPAAKVQMLEEDSLDDGPRQHRIYKVTAPNKKVTEQKCLTPLRSSSIIQTPKAINNNNTADVVISDDSDDPEEFISIKPTAATPAAAIATNNNNNHTALPVKGGNVCPPKNLCPPKNIDRNLHMLAKDHELCVMCCSRFQRIVQHYVNEHRGCEIYTSRLSAKQLIRMRTTTDNIAQLNLYKNGQSQYEATCMFCLKRCRFMLSYWHQHFSMHTGEYAYRCSGCGTRKPTRSLLHAHVNSQCRQGGTVRQDFNFDAKTALKIDARICSICNYVQLHRSNIVQHLRTQHGIKEIKPHHIQSVPLLKIAGAGQQQQQQQQMPPLVPIQRTTEITSGDSVYEISELDSSCSNLDQNDISDSSKMYFDYYNSEQDDSIAQLNYGEGDPSDDLSFMICGMLDVQMNTE